MKLQRRTVFLLGVAGGVAAVAVIAVGLVSLGHGRITRLRRQMQAEESSVVAGLRAQRHKEAIAQEHQRYQSYLRLDGLSDREVVGGFLKELEQLAQASHTVIISLTPRNEPVVAADGLKQYFADLRLEGSSEQTAEFLYQLHHSTLLIGLEKLSLGRKDEEARLLKMDASVQLAVP